MATAEQIKALLKSYVDGDEDQFLTVSMQVAAHAARRGQGKLAKELRDLVDEAKRKRLSRTTTSVKPLEIPEDFFGQDTQIMPSGAIAARQASNLLASEVASVANR